MEWNITFKVNNLRYIWKLLQIKNKKVISIYINKENYKKNEIYEVSSYWKFNKSNVR